MMLSVNLTRKQIENSPVIEMHRPVSRQYEESYYAYYGWPTYWDGSGMWGAGGFPGAMPPSTPENRPHHGHNQRDDVHLRSMAAVKGYDVQAGDGTIGSVASFMVDDKTWAVGDLVVETGHWYSGKEILIAAAKIQRISHDEAKVFVLLSRADIQRTPENEVARAGT
jgi:hypothetical protein